jgi:hypothetical protein
MLKLVFILLFALVVKTQVFANSSCDNYLNDCQYYTCIEASKHCGKKGYLLSFGNKYCHKFANKSEKFSLQGRLWMNQVRDCLIRQLDHLNPEVSCRKYKQAAIDQHGPCYINSGYCELPDKDKNVILKIIRDSLWKPTLFKAGITVLRQCARRS